MDIRIKVGVVVFDSQNRVLLIKEKTHKDSDARWNIIKGSYVGSETIFEAAKRECREEANVEAELTGVLGTYIAEKDQKMRVQCTFTAKTNDTPRISDTAFQASLGEFIEEVRWFTNDEIKEIKPEDFISNRTRILVQNISGAVVYPLDVLKHVEM